MVSHAFSLTLITVALLIFWVNSNAPHQKNILFSMRMLKCMWVWHMLMLATINVLVEVINFTIIKLHSLSHVKLSAIQNPNDIVL